MCVWICFRLLSLKTKDTSASSWLFDFVSYFLARYKNENKFSIYCDKYILSSLWTPKDIISFISLTGLTLISTCVTDIRTSETKPLLSDDRSVSTKCCYASTVREVAMSDWNGMSLIYRCLGFNKWTQLCVSEYDNKWYNQTHRNANNDLVNSNQCSAYTCFVTAKQTIYNEQHSMWGNLQYWRCNRVE